MVTMPVMAVSHFSMAAHGWTITLSAPVVDFAPKESYVKHISSPQDPNFDLGSGNPQLNWSGGSAPWTAGILPGAAMWL